jgi:hypothetical protein
MFIVEVLNALCLNALCTRRNIQAATREGYTILTSIARLTYDQFRFALKNQLTMKIF